VDLTPQVALVVADKADRDGNLYTGPNTEDTPITEAATFRGGIVVAQVAKLPRMKGSNMKRVVTTDNSPTALTEAQLAQLKALEGRSPNTADLPEVPESNWRRARRFYRPLKQPISIRVDADVLDWLRRKSDRYQTEINRILRKEMDAEIAD
jgi:uncharacterized protein (DUF4415 family)